MRWRVAVAGGMRPMGLDGLDKARMGLTTLEEVARAVTLLRVSDEETELKGRTAA